MSDAGSTKRVGLVAVSALVVAALGAMLAFAAFRGGGDDPVVPTSEGIDWADPQPLPEPAREDFRSEPAGDDGYRFWPRSSDAEPGVVYVFDTGHCGLDFLADFDGSFWTPIDPDGTGEPPVFFYNQDLGAIVLVDEDRAWYRSSDGTIVTLERVAGPVTTHPCD